MTEEREMTIGELLSQTASTLAEGLDVVSERPTDGLPARDVEKMAGLIGHAIGVLQMSAFLFSDNDEPPAPDVLDGYDAWANVDGDALHLTKVELASVGRYLESLRTQ